MATSYRRAYIEWCEKSMALLEQAMLDGGRPQTDVATTDERTA
jgi:hypothetical protein